MAATLITGTRLSRDEFLRIWDQLPALKNAGVLDGTVYVASPVGLGHGRINSLVEIWLGTYAARTPDCATAVNTTWLMLESAPQPDSCLYIETKIHTHGSLAAGTPELAVEISDSSHSHDFGPKLALYQRAGVREYITIDTVQRRLIWRRLVNGSYRPSRPENGILRSRALPGLWLHESALWSRDGAALLDTLHDGLASGEHQRFTARLRRQRPTAAS